MAEHGYGLNVLDNPSSRAPVWLRNLDHQVHLPCSEVTKTWFIRSTTPQVRMDSKREGNGGSKLEPLN